MKIKIKQVNYKFDYWMILITPLIDTINGYYILKNGATGISIGTFYRLLILVYIMLGLLKNKNMAFFLLTLFYYPFIGFIKSLSMQGSTFMACLTYSMKWVLPMALILYYCFVKRDKKDINVCFIECLNFWSVYVPCSIIVEYIFRLGYNTYFDAGFKGLYYSTNDISLVLIFLFVYSYYRGLNESRKKSLIISGLNLIAIVLLSTKSSLIFSVISIIVILFSSGRVSIVRKLEFSVLTTSILLLILFKMSEVLNAAILRYKTMWGYLGGYSFLSRFIIFATSGRSQRIIDELFRIKKGNQISNFLFGWIVPDNAHVVEMDWIDLLCQYGICGLVIAIFIYGYILKQCSFKTTPYFYMIMLGFIYATLAGHVISGALSGTIFAIVFVLLFNNSINNNRKDVYTETRR